MRFLKINPQVAVNTDRITEVKVTGTEGDVQLRVYTGDGTPYVYKRFKDFPAAERALIDLVNKLEDAPPVQWNPQ